ncbi:MAG: aspartate-semialdehyde dehydrogenase [Planctomycetota bacterium]
MSFHVAIAGVTGAVGQEFLRLLDEREFPLASLRPLASARSAGKTITFRGETLTIEELTEDSFDGIDIALFSAGGSISKKFAPAASAAGAIVIDNSSAFRMTPGVPLIVPEVNAHHLDDAGIAIGERIDGDSEEGAQHPFPGAGVIANPNCSTIIMLMAINPIHRAVGVKRLVAATYQAASGAGAAAMAELEQQTRESLDGTAPAELTQDIFGLPYAFNLFSHNSPMQPNGYNQEEMKMVHETHKIWGQNDPASQTAVTATCVRVPVMRAHAEAINLTLAAPLSEHDAREVLANAPGVSLIDDREANRFPTPLDASHQDDVFVGRIRQDISQPDQTGLDLFVCGDQIRKGAALNAVQIAEHLAARATATAG